MFHENISIIMVQLKADVYCDTTVRSIGSLSWIKIINRKSLILCVPTATNSMCKTSVAVNPAPGRPLRFQDIGRRILIGENHRHRQIETRIVRGLADHRHLAKLTGHFAKRRLNRSARLY